MKFDTINFHRVIPNMISLSLAQVMIVIHPNMNFIEFNGSELNCVRACVEERGEGTHARTHANEVQFRSNKLYAVHIEMNYNHNLS